MNIENDKLYMIAVENQSKMVYDNFLIINRRLDKVESWLERLEACAKRLELSLRVLESEIIGFGRLKQKKAAEQNPNA